MGGRAAPQALLQPDLSVDGAAFVLKLPDGKLLRGVTLQGAIVHMALGGQRVAAVKLESVVPDPDDPDIRAIDMRITRLRKKIEPVPGDPTVIKTVRGHGGGYEYVPADAPNHGDER